MRNIVSVSLLESEFVASYCPCPGWWACIEVHVNQSQAPEKNGRACFCSRRKKYLAHHTHTYMRRLHSLMHTFVYVSVVYRGRRLLLLCYSPIITELFFAHDTHIPSVRCAGPATVILPTKMLKTQHRRGYGWDFHAAS